MYHSSFHGTGTNGPPATPEDGTGAENSLQRLNALRDTLEGRLEQISGNVRELGDLIDQSVRTQAPPAPSGSDLPGAPVSEAVVRQVIKARRKRDSLFMAGIFSDPAWDIMLDLYAAHIGQSRICVTSCCHATGVPLTTALRWINTLEDRGIIQREQDHLDRRKVYLKLTCAAIQKMNTYFELFPPAPIEQLTLSIVEKSPY